MKTEITNVFFYLLKFVQSVFMLLYRLYKRLIYPVLEYYLSEVKKNLNS